MLAWLAGLTDGDGSIGIHKQSNNGNGQLVPRFSISTTCSTTYRHLDAVFNEIGIGRHWDHRKVKNPNWRDRWVVNVCGMRRVKPLLQMLLPHLVTKKEEAEILLTFIDERLTSPMRRGYTKSQLAMVDRMKEIKQCRHGGIAESSETNTPSIQKDDDRVRSMPRGIEGQP